MKSRLLASLGVALLIGIGSALLLEKEGDPEAVLAQVEPELQSLFQEENVFENPQAADPPGSWRTYEVQDPSGLEILLEIGREPTEDDLLAVVGSLSGMHSGGDPMLPASLAADIRRVVQVSPSWSEITASWQDLTWRNREIARARAMLRYETKPAGVSEYLWRDRHRSASAPWNVEQPRQLLLRRAAFGTVGLAGGFVGTFAILSLLAWLWSFLLARIRELSDAARGK